jgi:hypothetical protein
MSESTVFRPNQTMPLRPQRGLLGMPNCETCGVAFYPRQDLWQPGSGTMTQWTMQCRGCNRRRTYALKAAKGRQS